MAKVGPHSQNNQFCFYFSCCYKATRYGSNPPSILEACATFVMYYSHSGILSYSPLPTRVQVAILIWRRKSHNTKEKSLAQMPF